MDVLITGAGGRIGSHLARLLRSEGHRVRGLGLPADPGLARLAEESIVDAFEGDLTEPDSLADAVAGVDAICHLAAALTTHDVEDDAYVASNLNGTYNLLVAARDLAPGISRFVYTSSDAVYWAALSIRPSYLPIDEAHPLSAGSVYGATKIGAEALCRSFWRTYGIPYVVMRPTATANPSELVDANSPFGRRWFVRSAVAWLETRADADDRVLSKLKEYDDGGDRLFVMTDLASVASLTMLTDARDVAAGMAAMIEPVEAIGEAFNIGPEAPHSDRELVGELGRRLGLEVVEIPSESVRPSWHVSSAKARGVLGYRPRYTVFDMIAEATGERAHERSSE